MMSKGQGGETAARSAAKLRGGPCTKYVKQEFICLLFILIRAPVITCLQEAVPFEIVEI